MTMTKKDYELIAKSLNKVVKRLSYHNIRSQTVVTVIEQIAADLSGDNQSFDRTRFLEACGVTE